MDLFTCNLLGKVITYTAMKEDIEMEWQKAEQKENNTYLMPER